MATVYEEALQHPDWCPIQAQDCWTEMPAAAWTPLQRRLLDALPGERIAPRSFDLPGAAIPRRLANAVVERVAPDGASPLAFLQSPGAQRCPAQPCKGLPHTANSRSTCSTPAGARRRSRRSSAASSTSVVRSTRWKSPAPQTTTRALLWEKACRHEWPVTLAAGLPASLTRPGRALVGLGAWIESDFAAGDLRRLLQSGDVTLGDGDLSPGQAARVLVKAEAAWGRKTYELSLGKLSSRYRLRAGDTELPDDQRAAATQEGRAGRPAAGVDHVAAGRCSGGGCRRADRAAGPRGWRERLHRVLRGEEQRARWRRGHRAGRRHRRAEGARLVQVHPDGGPALHQRTRRWTPRRRATARGPVTSTSPRSHRSATPAALTCSSSDSKKAACFRRPPRIPCCSTSSASRISPLLRLSSDRSEEAVYAVLNRLAATSGSASMTLSYSCRDLREFRQTYPSWLMLQAHRIVSGQPEASFPELLDGAGRARVVRARQRHVGPRRGGLVAARPEARGCVGTCRGAAAVRRAAAGAPRRGPARFDDVHRVRRVRARGRRVSRPVRARRPGVGHPAREGRRVSLPPLPGARPGAGGGGRWGARQRCVARSADARFGAARALRALDAALSRREAPPVGEEPTSRAARRSPARRWRRCAPRCRRRRRKCSTASTRTSWTTSSCSSGPRTRPTPRARPSASRCRSAGPAAKTRSRWRARSPS